MTRYEDITRNWTDDSKAKSNVERVKFHYFNENGLYHLKKKMDKTINQWVDAGILPSGWIIAYGSLNYYYTDRIVELATKKRVNRIDLMTTLEGLQDHIDRGYERLGEFIMDDDAEALHVKKAREAEFDEMLKEAS